MSCVTLSSNINVFWYTCRKFFSFTAEDYKQRNQKSESSKSRLWIFRGKGHGKSSSVSSSVSSNSSTDTTPNSDDSISVSSAESPISFTPINKDKKRVLNSVSACYALNFLGSKLEKGEGGSGLG